jgi:hypothetical protein
VKIYGNTTDPDLGPLHVGNDINSVSLGPYGQSPGLNDFFNTSYLGFNCHRRYTANTWSTYSDGANGGVLFRANANGRLYISAIPRSGNGLDPDRTGTSGLTDQYINSCTVVQIWSEKQTNGSLLPRFDVNGTIRAKEVRVKVQGWWPDYVFDPSYKLSPLSELRNYIQTERHLPGMPSAACVAAQEDVDLGTMQTKLLEKVEELTLYILQLESRIKQLEGK